MYHQPGGPPNDVMQSVLAQHLKNSNSERTWRFLSSTLGMTWLLFVSTSAALAADPRLIDVAIKNGKQYLYSQQRDDAWEAEFEKHGDQKTGQTALVVEALLAAGESHQ